MKRHLYLALSLILISALFLAACGGDEQATETPLPAEVPTEAPTDVPTVAATEEPTPETGEGVIPIEVEEEGDFTILQEALEITGLIGSLNENVPYTLFAPPDAVFEAYFAAQDITKDDLFADAETLTGVLRYHLLFDAVDSDALARLDGETVITLNGAEIAITVNDEGAVVLNGAVMVILADREASNGLVHVIDGVLTIPVAAPEETAAPTPETTGEAPAAEATAESGD